MGVMKIMNQTGDTEIEWDPNDKESTEKAKERFKALKDDGYEFFEAVSAKGKQIKKFSKNLGKIIAAPAAKAKSDRGTSRRPLAMGGGPNEPGRTARTFS